MLGKIVGGVLGFMLGSVFGLIVGVLIGHAYDRGLFKALQFASPKNLRRIRDTFFDTTFLLAGYLAKVDGRVSEAEIAHAEQMFKQLGLDAQKRQEAIAKFKQGSSPGFDVDGTIAHFIEVCGRQQQLIQMMLLFLISQAHADQTLDDSERAALQRIATGFGISAAQLEQLIRMTQAQGQFSGGTGGAGASTPGVDSLSAAYQLLGVDASIDDNGLKRAYRKLMSENHPDKLIAQGLPESMIKAATERSQSIQAAYELIRKHRGSHR